MSGGIVARTPCFRASLYRYVAVPMASRWILSQWIVMYLQESHQLHQCHKATYIHGTGSQQILALGQHDSTSKLAAAARVAGCGEGGCGGGGAGWEGAPSHLQAQAADPRSRGVGGVDHGKEREGVEGVPKSRSGHLVSTCCARACHGDTGNSFQGAGQAKRPLFVSSRLPNYT